MTRMTENLRARTPSGTKPGHWDKLARQGSDAAPKYGENNEVQVWQSGHHSGEGDTWGQEINLEKKLEDENRKPRFNLKNK